MYIKSTNISFADGVNCNLKIIFNSQVFRVVSGCYLIIIVLSWALLLVVKECMDSGNLSRTFHCYKGWRETCSLSCWPSGVFIPHRSQTVLPSAYLPGECFDVAFCPSRKCRLSSQQVTTNWPGIFWVVRRYFLLNLYCIIKKDFDFRILKQCFSLQ